ncbi:MAG: ShlB/FhaC/HecB family hemolysin secretion/activation protein, partial [Sideroxydans sp.]|nr:ShlB/FhaC/HecB family hemolysin secretion/activation protein [Sideroxydans sp.]
AKWTFNYTRLQLLTQNNSLYFTGNGQWGLSNLDSAEKMSVGGAYSVRAYDTSVLSGDSGYSGTVELRHDLGSYAQGQWQAIAFVDGAHLIINSTPWATGKNTASLMGKGVGLNWSGPNQLSAKAYIANRLGVKPELVTDNGSTRVWFVMAKGF